jgi:TRAP transporter TAXI family solute receptor
MLKTLCAAAGMLALATAAQAAPPLGIGTSPQGTLTYRTGATYAHVAQQVLGRQIRVQPSSGTGVMVPLVNSQELDIGFMDTFEINAAFHGNAEFKGKPQKNLRAVAVIFPISVGMFVRKDSPIKSVADLKGKRLAWGYKSQQVIQTLVEGILANAGLTPKDIQPVLVPNLIRGIDEFVSGSVDAGFFAVGQAKVTEADAAVGGIRYLPLSDAPAAVKRMDAVIPTSYVSPVAPAPSRAGILSPTKLLTFDYVMFVNAKTPDDVVYKLTSVLAEHSKELAAGMPLFHRSKSALLYKDIGVPYHPGAIAYYKDHKIALTK